MPALNEKPPVLDRDQLRKAFLHHVTCSLGSTVEKLSPRERFLAIAYTVRDKLLQGLLATEQRYQKADSKRLYYLSMEFLIGRSMKNNLVNLEWHDACRDMLKEFGVPLEEVEENEPDAALGNGGLGRLAACFLDSLATLGLPGFGYGINYDYGLFKQEIRNGEQIEKPDNWRFLPTPWEIERPQDAVVVPLFGRVEHTRDLTGSYSPMWLDWRFVLGIPQDLPIVGYGGKTVNVLRLYTAHASQELDMSIFNDGDYVQAVQQQVLSETISKVLYPSAYTARGMELRLIQEYFLSACAVHDIVRRFLEGGNKDWKTLPSKVAIQLNDTHPTLAIAELMRILVDQKDVPWDVAWEICTQIFAYTNHTLLPEALEKWPVSLLERVLPRHILIIYEINQRFLDTVTRKLGNDNARKMRMSLIEEGEQKQVRMANMAIVGSHSVNGVAAVHSELVKKELVPDFYKLSPEKFNNKTNGVTPRRWLLAANPGLATLLRDTIGDGWITDLDQLRGLERFLDDTAFRERFQQIKKDNKKHLAQAIKSLCSVTVDEASLFDVQVKRIHEYKRQMLNLLHVVHEYLALVDDGKEPVVPRTYIFAGKAAQSYKLAKQIIRAINDVARVVNNDPKSRGLIKVAFVPDYRVTLAELMIPAAELSEQISTAGTEASGTGNMKFAMNGALTIGTMDGANIEICEEVGRDNIFIFGLTVDQVRQMQRSDSYRPEEIYRKNGGIRRVLDAFRDNRFSPGSPGQHAWLPPRLLAHGEQYFHLGDLESYLWTQDEVGRLYRDRTAWTRKAILNVARVGKFSSDRTIMDYAREIWKITAPRE